MIAGISLSLFAQAPLSDNMSASGALGQADLVTGTAGSTSTTMSNAFGVAVDPTTGKLFVADRNNNRVLRFSSANKMVTGSAAEAVLGQPDLTTVTAGTTSATMTTPTRVFVDASGRLWVSDYGNRRVLRFDGASAKANGAAADGVLGQPDFVTSTAGTTAAKMTRTTGIFVAGTTLWVAERDNNRVLRFDNAASKANGASADGVLGQPDFTTATGGLTAATMSGPFGVFVDAGGRLWVAEDGNNRVLRFDNAAAKSNGGSADGVLGQPNFTSNSATTPTQNGFGNVRGVWGDGLGRIYAVEEGNHRIMIFNNAASVANGANADNVLGQPDFVTAAAGTTATGLNFPNSMFIDNANNTIWVADAGNNRVVRFTASPLPVELVSFTATVVTGKVSLNWATATEVNNAGFAVEKKAGTIWNKIGYVEGNGNSNAPKQYSFTDNTSAGKYQYRLKQIDRDGRFEYSNIVEATVALTAADYKLGQNYPNPFNPTTTITFALKNTEHASITVYNMLGQEVATLFNGVANANELYLLSFDAKNLASGMYIYALRSASKNEVKKMNLLK
jgi:sugar lactone lactonase YvrE